MRTARRRSTTTASTTTSARGRGKPPPPPKRRSCSTVSYFADHLGAGTHDVKLGSQLSWEKMQYDRIRNGDLFLETQDGVALRAQIGNTPVHSDHRLRTWSAFAQDRWIIGRATINYG